MKHPFISFFLISLLLLLSGCNNKQRDNIESFLADSLPQTGNPSEYYGIYDGETVHRTTEEEAAYHSSKGINSPEDAYLKGYDTGFEAGERDASDGKKFRYSYNSSNDLHGYYSESYENGYDHGYSDAYYTNQPEDDDQDEEDNPDFYEQDFD